MKTMLLAIRALPGLAGRLVVNLLPVLAVVGFVAALGACGGKMGDGERAVFAPMSAAESIIKRMTDGERAAVFVPVLAAAAIIGTSGSGDSGNAPATMTETPAPTMPETPAPTMPEPMPTEPQPMGFDFDAPELGGLYLENIEVVGSQAVFRRHFIILSVAAGGENRRIFGSDIPISRQMVIGRQIGVGGGAGLPDINRASLHADGDIVPLVESGATVRVAAGGISVAFQMRPTITALVQLCPITWIASYLGSSNFTPDNPCSPMDEASASYSPQMQQVVYAAMADGFNRGVGIGESPFAFSGRYDGDNRSAGFTYDWGGGYAFRTDYIRLPSRQDSEVWLDTYRFGAISRLNDEVRVFTGMDNYRNAIFAIDAKGDNGNNLHRLGFASGNGYAVKYEYRLNL